MLAVSLPFHTALGATAGYDDVMIADFNGDGRQQVVGRVGSTGNWWSGQYEGDRFVQEVLAQWPPTATFVDVRQVDLDRDGAADIVGRNLGSGDWLWTHFDGTHYQTETLGTWTAGQRYELVLVDDFNGDGQRDIAGFDQEKGDWLGLISSAHGYETAQLATWESGEDPAFMSALDLDGNGRAEIVGYAAQAHSWIGLIYEDGQFRTRTLATLPAGSGLSVVQAADLNGDGRVELIAFDRSTATWWALSTEGSEFVVTPLAIWPDGLSPDQVRVADLNGDGLPDVVARTGKTWKYLYFDGRDYHTAVLVTTNARSYLDVLIGDASGDELSDLVARDSRGNWWLVNQARFLGNWMGDLDFVQLADLNGDGKDDLFGVSPATGNWWALCSADDGRFVHERLSNWNQDWYYAWTGFVNSDQQLANLIRRQVPGLNWLLGHGTLQAARLLTDWAANQANVTQSSFNLDPAWSAASMYNFFLRRNAGVFCGGMAVFNTAVLRLFGLDAFSVGFGDPRYFVHVVSMVRINGQFYLFDPTYDAVYYWRGRYASMQTLLTLYARKRLDEVTIKSAPLDMRQVLLRTPKDAPTLEARGKLGHFYIYGTTAFDLDKVLATMHFKGYPQGVGLMMKLLTHRIFWAGPESSAAASFRDFAAARGIPVG